MSSEFTKSQEKVVKHSKKSWRQPKPQIQALTKYQENQVHR